MERRTSRIVTKPWGHEEVFAETDRYVGKLLVIHAGEALSLQYHRRKEETLRVMEGTIDVALGPSASELVVHRLGTGEVFHVAPGTLHRMTAISDCTLLEVSTPELDDVVRLEDRYGREGTSTP